MLAMALSLVMVLELGVTGDVKVHADEPVKVISSLEVCTSTPADGNTPDEYGYFNYTEAEEEEFSVGYSSTGTKWWIWQGNFNTDVSTINEWNSDNWKVMGEGEKFVKGKIYAVDIDVKAEEGFEVPHNQLSYSTNKYGHIIEAVTWEGYDTATVTIAYKCGAALRGFYTNMASEPVIGKTAGELSALTFETDPAGAISETMMNEMMKETNISSIWEVSTDGENYVEMPKDEKFTYGKYYRYNAGLVFSVVLLVGFGFEELFDEKVVTGFSENARFYFNNVPFDEDFENNFKSEFEPVIGTVDKVEIEVAAPVAGECPSYDAKFVGDDSDKMDFVTLPGIENPISWYAYNPETDKFDIKMAETDKFEEGKRYQAAFCVNPKSGCEYSKEVKYFVNGEVSERTLFAVIREFTATKKEEPKVDPAKDDATKELEVGETVTVGKFEYTVKVKADGKNPGEVELSKAAKKNVKTLTVPTKVEVNGAEYKVTSIKAGAFKNNKKLKKVTIGKSIVKIGAKAFYGCNNLKKVVIKSKVLKKVGKKAFYRKKGKKITFTVPKKKKKAYKKLIKKAKTNKYKVK